MIITNKHQFFLFFLSIYSFAVFAQKSQTAYIGSEHRIIKQHQLHETTQSVTPTKYAIVLYSDEVTATNGNNQKMGSHFVIKGSGSLSWKRDITAAGDYEIAVSYSAKAGGSKIKVFTAQDSIQSVLAVTASYYSANQSEWSSFNCERKLVNGILHLSAGANNIKVDITGVKGTEINLYAIELIPVAKKNLISKDFAKAAKAKPDMSWFTKMPYGLMFHWTSQSAPENGPIKPYNEAVNAFDVGAFTTMVKKTGASYVIFTTNHAEPYFPAPLKTWEAEFPNHTTKRDLVAEIADSLSRHDIKLILYLATHIYSKFDKVDDADFNRLNFSLLSEIGERYKKKVVGYWLDGWYQSYAKHPSFDFEKLYKVSKAGNPNRLLTLNSWLYPTVSNWQDYWAGEVYKIGNPTTERILKNGPGKGLPAQHLIVMENDDWLHQPLNTKIYNPSINADELTSFISKNIGKGPVTINIQIYQDGRISEEALKVMETVKQNLKK
jgi:hypothetical protein